MASYYNPEYLVHKAICQYLNVQYPFVIYHSDAMGLNLTKAQRGMFKPLRKSTGFPDLMILEPKGVWHGMFLEIKADGKSPFKKDGTIKSSEHLKNQDNYHAKLQLRGYKALFVVGFDQAKQVIDDYMNLD